MKVLISLKNVRKEVPSFLNFFPQEEEQKPLQSPIQVSWSGRGGGSRHERPPRGKGEKRAKPPQKMGPGKRGDFRLEQKQADPSEQEGGKLSKSTCTDLEGIYRVVAGFLSLKESGVCWEWGMQGAGAWGERFAENIGRDPRWICCVIFRNDLSVGNQIP